MILVTIGTKKEKFDKLFKIVDDFAPNFDDDVIIQVGESDFKPKNSKCISFIKEDEMQILFDQSNVIVSPIGVGTIMNALPRKIPIVFFPEKKDLKDDYFIAKTIEKMGRGILSNYDNICKDIINAKNMKIGEYTKNTELVNHLSDILKSYDEQNH